MELIDLILEPIDLLITVIIDILIFTTISKLCKNRLDYIVLIALSMSVFSLSLFGSTFLFNTFGLTIIEIIILYFYFHLIKGESSVLILGSSLIFSLFDLLISVSFLFLMTIIPSYNIIFDVLNIILNVIELVLVYKYKNNIIAGLHNKNSKILVGLGLYLYITGTFITYYLSINLKNTIAIKMWLFVIILQIIFIIIVYYEVIHMQKSILTQEQQKRLELKNEQLKEYSGYLEKNEDELRRFKHDYQNILSSLMFSAKQGDVQNVLDQLIKYTNSNFNEKALLKYKGVNHIHIEELKSILIVKLAKAYSNEINYTFTCDENINKIPNNIDLLDLIRIIGIVFDNAIEESLELNKIKDNAQIDILLYQEDGDFEFEIKNKIRKQQINTKKIQQKNYTTKLQHMGLGLSNIEKVVSKYSDKILINYEIRNEWFTFALVILPESDNLYE